jgi:predicted CoA-substrate-specific enzyme activase
VTLIAGIDVGSTYTKAVIIDQDAKIIAKSILSTGFLLAQSARTAFLSCLTFSGLCESDISYIIATGFGRHQVSFKDISVTELTASAAGARHFFPGASTVLDIGGQTTKVICLDPEGRIQSFRFNDKCAAGTGAFLEKTAHYMGYSASEIGPLAALGKNPATISGVCAVFAESEVINHLSIGTSPHDIMLGAMLSLVDRSVQLIRRAKGEPDFVLIGGLFGFETMAQNVAQKLYGPTHIPSDGMCQFIGAFGSALLARRRLKKIARF